MYKRGPMYDIQVEYSLSNQGWATLGAAKRVYLPLNNRDFINFSRKQLYCLSNSFPLRTPLKPLNSPRYTTRVNAWLPEKIKREILD